MHSTADGPHETRVGSGRLGRWAGATRDRFRGGRDRANAGGRGRLLAFLAGVLALILWPFTALWGWWRGRDGKATEKPQGDDQAKGEGGESSSQPEEPEGGSGAAEKAPEPSPDEEPKEGEGEGAPEEQEEARGAEEAASAEQSSTNTKTRSITMSVNPLVQATAELQGTLANYAPEDMWQVRQEIRQLPQVAENMALAFRVYVQQLVNNYPVDKQVTEQMFEVFQAIARAAEPAAEVAPLFEQIHAAEIARADAPRQNEQAWNV